MHVPHCALNMVFMTGIYVSTRFILFEPLAYVVQSYVCKGGFAAAFDIGFSGPLNILRWLASAPIARPRRVIFCTALRVQQ
ncbi:unnamed protein product, partial [Nesidiocoris tenuis]